MTIDNNIQHPHVGLGIAANSDENAGLLALCVSQTASAPTKIEPKEESVKISAEEIVPLPSPSTSTLIRKNTFTKHQVLSPEKIDSAIPLVNCSPAFSFNGVIPSLKDDPMLGDMDCRESKFPSPGRLTDKSLTGKHIWKFRMKYVLGTGSFATVYLAENLEEGGVVAIKTINKERIFEDLRSKCSVEREAVILKCLKHDKIVQLEATMETEKHLCFVLEYVPDGDLFDFSAFIHTENLVTEDLVKKVLFELIEVVTWLHDHNIVHRDIKLENIMVYYDRMTSDPHIKLTDFGLARVIDPNEPRLTTKCGSLSYTAPEVICYADYDARLSDTWSVGVVAYVLLFGCLPFSHNENIGETNQTLLHRIASAKLRFPMAYSQDAMDVLNGLLTRDPDQRTSLKDIVKFPWFEGL